MPFKFKKPRTPKKDYETDSSEEDNGPSHMPSQARGDWSHTQETAQV